MGTYFIYDIKYWVPFQIKKKNSLTLLETVEIWNLYVVREMASTNALG